jgi:hypothetical protein
MPRNLKYPRNEATRRDRILNHDIIHGAPRNELARNDTLAANPHSANVAPTIALTGTAISGGALEAEIVTGAETIIITLTNDTWHPDLGADNAITDAFIAAITGDDAGATGWDDQILAGDGALAFGDVARTSSTVVTITLPASASFAIAADETVTVAPPAGSTVRNVAPASQTFDISIITVALTGTMVAGGVLESEMVTGGETLIVTLTGDTWHADIGADNAITTAFLAGITGNDDYATIAALTDFEDVARTSDTIVTLTYPAGGAYAIAADEDVTVVLPASALALGVVPATPAAVTITAE